MPNFEFVFSTIFNDDGDWVNPRKPYPRIVFLDDKAMAEKVAKAMGVNKETKKVHDEVGSREYLFEPKSVEETDEELSDYWLDQDELVWDAVLRRLNLDPSRVVFKYNSKGQKAGFSLRGAR